MALVGCSNPPPERQFVNNTRPQARVYRHRTAPIHSRPNNY